MYNFAVQAVIIIITVILFRKNCIKMYITKILNSSNILKHDINEV